jgi:hypothetical protein
LRKERGAVGSTGERKGRRWGVLGQWRKTMGEPPSSCRDSCGRTRRRRRRTPSRSCLERGDGVMEGRMLCGGMDNGAKGTHHDCSASEVTPRASTKATETWTLDVKRGREARTCMRLIFPFRELWAIVEVASIGGTSRELTSCFDSASSRYPGS